MVSSVKCNFCQKSELIVDWNGSELLETKESAQINLEGGSAQGGFGLLSLQL